jgi:hypothetical protein
VFPDWKLTEGDRLERSCGPIVQEIGFEALSFGPYRPMAVLWALPLPTVSMLHQFLDVKHSHVRLRDHPQKWKDVVAAMEQQFRPSIRKPLDVGEIKVLCEQEALEKKESTNDLCMLAILNAYLGEDELALSYCRRMQTVPPPTLAPQLDWEERHKEFGRQLRQAIEQGKVREFLEWEQSEWERGNKKM